MKSTVIGWCVVVSLLAILSAPASAHHSVSMFNLEKTVTLQGTVKQFLFTNPHSWLQVMVTGTNGKTVQWDFETQGPSTLLRTGIKAKTFQAGDKVTVVTHPMKDGRTAGLLMKLTRADGRVFTF